jgi:two-component system response regulator HydG
MSDRFEDVTETITGAKGMPDTPRWVLVVDDEPDTCANLADILGDLGYQVDVAHSGPQALKLAAGRMYDLALLDLRMPGMDGLELYRQLKERSAGTVAILVTAYASGETAQRARDAGAWQILPKPVDIAKLLELVQQALDQPLVLVVDDDRELCATLWDVLRERGYRVHLAHDVPQAGSVLAGAAIEVVLLDLKLPGGDGTQVLQQIRRQAPQARTILITAYRDELEEKVQAALAEGASTVCYKPLEMDNLLQQLHSLCQFDPGSK